MKVRIDGLEMFATPHPRVVACDYPDCPSQFPEGVGITGDDKRLRLEAIFAGWIVIDGKDYCPDHNDGAPA